MKKSIQHLFGILIPMRFFALALWKDSIVKICASVLLLLLLFSIFVFIIFPDAPRFAVTESLAIGNQPPGFQVTLLRIVPNSTYPEQDFFSRMISGPASNDLFIPIISHQYDGNDIVIKEYSASGDSSFVSRYNIADVIYPVNMQKEITERNGQLAFEKSDGTPAEESINLLQGIIDGQNISTRKFILGTDRKGRDILSRLVVSTRATLWPALLVAFLALLLGLVTGIFTGLLKDNLKKGMLWVIKSWKSIPAMLLIIAVMFIIGNGFWHLCLVSGFVLSFQVSQAIAFRMFAIRRKQYLESAAAIGIPRIQVLSKYILPELYKPVFAATMTIFFAAVLVESSLSFLGLGLGENIPSWGNMVRENYGYVILPGYAYLAIIPGFAIAAVSFVFAVMAWRIHMLTHEDFDRTLV